MPVRLLLGNDGATGAIAQAADFLNLSDFQATGPAVATYMNVYARGSCGAKHVVYRGASQFDDAAVRVYQNLTGQTLSLGWNPHIFSSPVPIVSGAWYRIGGNTNLGNGFARVSSGSNTKRVAAPYTTFAPPDLVGVLSDGGAYTICASLYGWIPPEITSIGVDDNILDNETSVQVVGTDFTNGEGILKIWLCSTSDFATAPIKVEQIVTPDNDTGATFDVVPTDLSPGTVYAFSETIIGGISQISAAYPITLTAHVIRADSYKARKHAHHAEIKLGCIIADNFRSQSSSEENGATITGGVTFDRFKGMETDGTGRAEFIPWGLTDGSIVVAFKADSEGPIAATAPIHDGSPVDGWCIWVDAEGVHATHSDGSSLATECLVEEDFLDGEDHVLTYAIDLTGGSHVLYVDGESDEKPTSITGPLSEEDGIIVGGFGSDGITGEIGGFRMFNGTILTEADHNAYAS